MKRILFHAISVFEATIWKGRRGDRARMEGKRSQIGRRRRRCSRPVYNTRPMRNKRYLYDSLNKWKQAIHSNDTYSLRRCTLHNPRITNEVILVHFLTPRRRHFFSEFYIHRIGNRLFSPSFYQMLENRKRREIELRRENKIIIHTIFPLKPTNLTVSV